MSVEAWIAYVLALSLLAITPGPGWAAVVTASIAKGSKTAFAMAFGIALGDVCLILFTVTGLAVLAKALGTLFVVIKLGGAAYLIWLGVRLWRNPPCASVDAPSTRRALGPFLGGFALTLGNAKVIAFYLGFLPVFVDLDAMTRWDTALLAATTFAVVAMALSGCAAAAARSGRFLRAESNRRRMGRVLGSTLIGTGILVASR